MRMPTISNGILRRILLMTALLEVMATESSLRRRLIRIPPSLLLRRLRFRLLPRGRLKKRSFCFIPCYATSQSDMIFIHKRFETRWRTREPKLRVPERVTAEMLWQKLESMYDLSALNFENQMPAALMEEKEFQLPSKEFGAVMDEYSLRRLSLGDEKGERGGGGRGEVGDGNADRKRDPIKSASKRGRRLATAHSADSPSSRSASASRSNSSLTSMLVSTATASTPNALSTSKLTSDSLKSSSMVPIGSSLNSSIRSTST